MVELWITLKSKGYILTFKVLEKGRFWGCFCINMQCFAYLCGAMGGVFGCRRQKTDVSDTIFPISNTIRLPFTWRDSEPQFAANGWRGAPFWLAKCTVLTCKTHHFALQNWHFCVAKLALLECKTHHFRIRWPFDEVLKSALSAYYQILILQ